ncbi:MAG: prolipoprotein diacylglyceryl transferase [Alphaproteobacteria bacterium]|nr:prolipoprotein diacylglyceryl transferase [Alphaproteobacteria bacterium]
MSGFAYPDISPVLFDFGMFELRWYSLAYLAGIVAAWILIGRNIKKYALPISRKQLDDMMFNITLGIILGGRIFYVLFYNLEMFLAHPFEIFALWHGGMSFHGGLFGVIVALFYSAKKMGYPFLGLSDMAALYTPIGLFLGRCANFINDELWGKPANLPWAVRFPSGGYIPRHPSQLYEAMLEGVVLFCLLQILWRFEWVRSKKGFVSGVFLSFYALARIFVEMFRMPDVQIGYLFAAVTMGQMLSVPLLIVGVWLMIYATRQKSAAK